MAKPPNILSPEDGAELKLLYAAHSLAVERAKLILQTRGMESREFFEADGEAGEIWMRIRELLGSSGDHWMA